MKNQKINFKNYSAKYFLKTEKIVNKFLKDSEIVLQFKQVRDNVVLCGMKQVIEFLEKNTDTTNYKIKFLKDGSIIKKNEVVLELTGNYSYFGVYENIILGILTRASSVATNANRLCSLTKKAEIIAMCDRQDYYKTQELDGYACSIGGIKKVVTKAQTFNNTSMCVGTIPHTLIQMFEGNLINTLKCYKKLFITEYLVALVDYNNNVIGDSLKALKEFKSNLKFVRVDTSKSVYDKYFLSKKTKKYGVNIDLIKALRKELDENNGKHVKIIVSSGFNYDKIQEFEAQNTPVDYYGVGKSLLNIFLQFHCDSVMINGKKNAKFGREYIENKNLIEFKKLKSN